MLYLYIIPVMWIRIHMGPYPGVYNEGKEEFKTKKNIFKRRKLDIFKPEPKKVAKRFGYRPENKKKAFIIDFKNVYWNQFGDFIDL